MNTRFNPATNGDLHLGHAYMALVNEHAAHSSGGGFILRFDDNTRHIMAAHGGAPAMLEIASGQHNDLLWLGLEIDSVEFHSEREEDVKQFLSGSRFCMVISHFTEGTRDTAPTIVSDPEVSPREMCAWTIAERVVLDRWSDIDTVIRGIGLLQNHALYMYFCALLGFRFPRCYYLPRLTMADGTDISKTARNCKIRALRDEGVSLSEMMHLLKQSCLHDPSRSWGIDNVKRSPRLLL